MRNRLKSDSLGFDFLLRFSYSLLQLCVKKSKVKREPSEEIDLLDKMLDSLVELLEEKGILTQEEYEKRIMEKVKIK
jgi:hypothetical protein